MPVVAFFRGSEVLSSELNTFVPQQNFLENATLNSATSTGPALQSPKSFWPWISCGESSISNGIMGIAYCSASLCSWSFRNQNREFGCLDIPPQKRILLDMNIITVISFSILTFISQIISKTLKRSTNSHHGRQNLHFISHPSLCLHISCPNWYPKMRFRPNRPWNRKNMWERCSKQPYGCLWVW